jgi:ABC-type transport system substrate-binding protein
MTRFFSLSVALLIFVSACARAPESPPTPAAAAKPTAAQAQPTTAPAAAPAQATTAPAAPAKPAAAAASPQGQATTAAAAQPGKRGGELIIGKDLEAPGLDPAKNPASAAIRIFDLLYSRLIRLDDQMRPVPDLATSWDVSPDAKTYTFHLRQGVKFHNGRELTSDDVKYTYERILNPDTASIARSYFATVDSIETPDKYTVRFNLKEPYTPFLLNTATSWAGIVAKEIVDANGGNLNKAEAGSGPFKLQEWTPDTKTVMIANRDYYVEGQPVVDQITWLIMPEESARIAALRTGQIQYTTLTAAGYDTLANDPNLTAVSAPTLSYFYLGMNVARAPFDDVRVRQAISYAVDRNEIVNAVFRGQARLTGPVPTSMANYAVDPGQFASYKPDLTKAKQLMADAGVTSARATLQPFPGAPYAEAAQIVQNQLKQIGLDITIQPVETGQYVDNWTKKNMDLMVGGNGSGTTPDRAVCFFFCTTGSANVWNFTDTQVDDLAVQARQTTDDAKAKQLYSQAETRIVDLAPNLFLANQNQFVAYSKKLSGFKTMPDGTEPYLVQTSIQQ